MRLLEWTNVKKCLGLALMICVLALPVLAEEAAISAYEAFSTPGEWNFSVEYETLMDSKELIQLTNRDNLLSDKYKPSDLVKIKVRKSTGEAIELRKVASAALTQMFEDASTQGVTLYALSGFRSYGTQNTMYHNRLEKNNGVDDLLVAYPGASDHQTGLGVDVINKASQDARLSTTFAGSKEALWLAEHCWEYGFIVRYAENKEDITGIKNEPWHLRYVGEEIAAYIMNNDLCLEEFTVEWQAEVAAFEG